MKKRFIKIASAITAAALSLTFSACSKVTDDESSYHFEPRIIENNVHLAVNFTNDKRAYDKAYDKVYDSEYQKQLAREDFKERIKLAEQGSMRDPYIVSRYLSNKKAHTECVQLGLCDILELEPMENAEYVGWEGTFEVDSIEDAGFYVIAERKNLFSLSLGGTTTTVTTDYGYWGNYKEANIEFTYADGTLWRNTMGFNEETLTVSAPPKDSTITKATYEFTMNIGGIKETDKLEIIRITLVKK